MVWGKITWDGKQRMYRMRERYPFLNSMAREDLTERVTVSKLGS